MSSYLDYQHYESFLEFVRNNFMLYDGDFYADTDKVRKYLTINEADYPLSYERISKIYVLELQK
jgi:hypothetical protein